MSNTILPKLNGKGGAIVGGGVVSVPVALLLYYLISQNSTDIEAMNDKLHKIDKNVVVLCTKLDAKCSP